MVGGAMNETRVPSLRQRQRRRGRQEPVIDLGALDDLRRLYGCDDGDFLPRFLQLFLDHSERLMVMIDHAGVAHDFQTIGFACHSLKSSSIQIGAHGFATMCARLETLAEKRAAADIPPLISALQRAYVPVRRALQAERQGAAS